MRKVVGELNVKSKDNENDFNDRDDKNKYYSDNRTE